MKAVKTILAGVIGMSMMAGQAMGAAKVEAGVPVYQKASGVSGNISSVGSDTLANLMTLWAEEFKRNYPNVNIQIQAAGSSTAPPALSEGTANLGPMSRKMKNKELEAFEKKHGYQPMAIPVAIDALAVYVHKDNPIKGLTLPQVDAIFSSTRKFGHPEDITRWSEAGVGSSLGSKNIQIYGRNSVSGTYGYFKKKALKKGDFKNTVNEQPGSASVVQSVSSSINGIGYSGVGYKTSGVKAVALAKKPGQAFVEASNEPLAPLEREFIKMVLSKVGQEVVIKDGYIPLPARVIEKQLKAIQ
jgi:phosphate transport system substrate-binding protein